MPRRCSNYTTTIRVTLTRPKQATAHQYYALITTATALNIEACVRWATVPGLVSLLPLANDLRRNWCLSVTAFKENRTEKASASEPVDWNRIKKKKERKKERRRRRRRDKAANSFPLDFWSCSFFSFFLFFLNRHLRVAKAQPWILSFCGPQVGVSDVMCTTRTDV